MTHHQEPRRSWLRRWLDRRREGQRRAGEIARRRKAAREEDAERMRGQGVMGPSDRGPFGGSL
jgi:hypothetical protein